MGEENKDTGVVKTDDAASGVADKGFTQEQVNNIVAKEVKKTQESFLKDIGFDDIKNAKDGMGKYKEWIDSQKTESQKLLDENTVYKTKLTDMESKVKEYENTFSLLKKNVKQDSLTDFGVLMRATGEQDFDKAFETVSKKYPTMLTDSGSGEDKNAGKGDNKGAAENKNKHVTFGKASNSSATSEDARLAAFKAKAGAKK